MGPFQWTPPVKWYALGSQRTVIIQSRSDSTGNSQKLPWANFGSEGREFESLRGHNKPAIQFHFSFLLKVQEGSTSIVAISLRSHADRARHIQVTADTQSIFTTPQLVG